MTTPSTPSPTLRRMAQVQADTGLSRSGIYRLLAEGEFPEPVKISEQAIAFVGAEVDAWIAGRIAARDAARIAKAARKVAAQHADSTSVNAAAQQGGAP